MRDASATPKHDAPLTVERGKVRFVAHEPATGWPEKFGILSAWKPFGENSHPLENSERHICLVEKAKHSGLFHFPITKSVAGADGKEDAVAVCSCQPEKMAMWGREFGQHEIYFVDEGELSVIACDSGERQALGRFLDRLELLSGHGPGLRVMTAAQFSDKVKAVKLRNITWADDDELNGARKDDSEAGKATVLILPKRTEQAAPSHLRPHQADHDNNRSTANP